MNNERNNSAGHPAFHISLRLRTGHLALAVTFAECESVQLFPLGKISLFSFSVKSRSGAPCSLASLLGLVVWSLVFW